MVHASGAESTDLSAKENVDELCGKCKTAAENWKPVADERLTLQLDNLQSDIDRYQASLMQYIKRHFETDYKGSPMDVFKRDNDHKSTFFA